MTHVVTGVDLEVGLFKSLVVTVDCAGHAGPRGLESEDTLNTVTNELNARDGVD